MKPNTHIELINFIKAVEQLTAATVTTIGLQTASEILSQCHITKEALRTDETISDSGPVSN